MSLLKVAVESTFLIEKRAHLIRVQSSTKTIVQYLPQARQPHRPHQTQKHAPASPPPTVRTFGRCMMVRFGRGTPVAWFPFVWQLNADRLDRAGCQFIVWVAEGLVYFHHVALL